MTRSFTAEEPEPQLESEARSSGKPDECDDPDGADPSRASVEGEHSAIHSDSGSVSKSSTTSSSCPSQVTLGAFADGGSGSTPADDSERAALWDEIERLDDTTEEIIKSLDRLSDAVVEAIEDDNATEGGEDGEMHRTDNDSNGGDIRGFQ